jgi:hypothetical protein
MGPAARSRLTPLVKMYAKTASHRTATEPFQAPSCKVVLGGGRPGCRLPSSPLSVLMHVTRTTPCHASRAAACAIAGPGHPPAGPHARRRRLLALASAPTARLLLPAPAPLHCTGSYGRGAGYGVRWTLEWSMDGAWSRCRADNPDRGCEQWGAVVCPKCAPGFRNVACCTCSPDCPVGFNDMGVSCTKPTYGQGVGKFPQCGGDEVRGPNAC